MLPQCYNAAMLHLVPSPRAELWQYMDRDGSDRRLAKSRRVEDTAVRRVDVDVPRSGEASFSEFRRALRKATERS